MERAASVLIALGLVAGFAGAAQAKPSQAEAVLAAAPQGEARQVIDGRLWKCLGTGCRGISSSAAKSQPILFECQGVAAKFGAVSAYRSGRRSLDAGQIAQCNTAAAPAGAVGASAVAD